MINDKNRREINAAATSSKYNKVRYIGNATQCKKKFNKNGIIKIIIHNWNLMSYSGIIGTIFWTVDKKSEKDENVSTIVGGKSMSGKENTAPMLWI